MADNFFGQEDIGFNPSSAATSEYLNNLSTIHSMVQDRATVANGGYQPERASTTQSWTDPNNPNITLPSDPNAPPRGPTQMYLKTTEPWNPKKGPMPAGYVAGLSNAAEIAKLAGVPVGGTAPPGNTPPSTSGGGTSGNSGGGGVGGVQDNIYGSGGSSGSSGSSTGSGGLPADLGPLRSQLSNYLMENLGTHPHPDQYFGQLNTQDPWALGMGRDLMQALPGQMNDRLALATQQFGGANDTFDAARGYYGQMIGALDPANAAYANMGKAINPAAAAYGNMGNAINPAAGAYASMLGSIAPANAMYGNMANAINPVNAAYAQMGGAINPAQSSIGNMLDFYGGSDFNNAISRTAGMASGQFGTDISQQLQNIQASGDAKLQGTLNQIREKYGAMGLGAGSDISRALAGGAAQGQTETTTAMGNLAVQAGLAGQGNQIAASNSLAGLLGAKGQGLNAGASQYQGIAGLYGAQGAGLQGAAGLYGQTAAGLGNISSLYGQAGAGYGNLAGLYGQQGAGYGQLAGLYGQQGAGYGNLASLYGQAGAGMGAIGQGYSQLGTGLTNAADVYGKNVLGVGGNFLGQASLEEQINSSNIGRSYDDFIRTSGVSPYANAALGYATNFPPLTGSGPSNAALYGTTAAQAGTAITTALIIASAMSDRDMKTAVRPTAMKALEGIRQLDVPQWRYRGEDDPHMGPMAQDFQRVFGLGNGRVIMSVDALGVMFKAIKELDEEVRALRKERE